MIPKDFTANLKEQWLDYCQSNPSIISAFKKAKFGIKSADGGFRPYGLFILGVICGLSPETSDFISVLFKLTSEADNIVRALGLDFDPEIELEKRAEELAKIQEVEVVPLLSKSNINPDTDYLNQFRN
jgi:Family of unknown function (DUF5331)